jgi:hypothetical protein
MSDKLMVNGFKKKTKCSVITDIVTSVDCSILQGFNGIFNHHFPNQSEGVTLEKKIAEVRVKNLKCGLHAVIAEDTAYFSAASAREKRVDMCSPHK